MIPVLWRVPGCFSLRVASLRQPLQDIQQDRCLQIKESAGLPPGLPAHLFGQFPVSQPKSHVRSQLIRISRFAEQRR